MHCIFDVSCICYYIDISHYWRFSVDEGRTGAVTFLTSSIYILALAYSLDLWTETWRGLGCRLMTSWTSLPQYSPHRRIIAKSEKSLHGSASLQEVSLEISFQSAGPSRKAELLCSWRISARNFDIQLQLFLHHETDITLSISLYDQALILTLTLN